MKKTINFILTFISLLALGCSSDYKIRPVPEDVEPGVQVPEIEVSPLSHDFGPLSAGSEVHSTSVTIDNIGNGELNISNIYLNNGISNFSLTIIPIGTVEPLGAVELIVEYSPGTYETNSDIISILSNDEDEPEVRVLLDGSGDAPVITITPGYYDFGTVYLGCDDTIPVEIGNIGNSNLIISDIEYFASLPVDFSIQPYEDVWGYLPITIAPGDIIGLDVNYFPLDTLDDSAYIEVVSNDPATPIANADQDGLGDYEAWATDTYIQDGTVDVDILFVIDNSGSMGSNQTNLKNNFDSFMAAFSSAGVSYQIALITTDNPTFVGDIITSATADPISEFRSQIDSIGTHGSAIEQGLLMAHNSTSGAGDASPSSPTGFFRTASRLVIVYISDEPDMSTYASTLTPSDYSSQLLSLKSSAGLIVAHAIAGDYPSGCSSNGGAQFGDRYYDVVGDLGGTFMSICASDWSTTMDSLARDSIALTDFPLSDRPIEGTIGIKVNGFVSYDWVYNTSENSISMLTAPSDGSIIDVTYALWAECE